MRQNGYGSTFKKNLGNGVMIMKWKSSSERKKAVCFWLYMDTRGHRYSPLFRFDISKGKPLKALITVPPLRFYTIILNNEIMHRRGCALNRLTLSKYFVSMALQEADLRSHQCPSETHANREQMLFTFLLWKTISIDPVVIDLMVNDFKGVVGSLTHAVHG